MTVRGSTLDGRVAIVTGASSGIGRATALALSREGARVVLVGRDRQRLASAAAQVQATAGAQGTLSLQLDVGREEDMESMRARTLERFGQIDILVAAAGIQRADNQARRLPYSVGGMPAEEWDAVIRTNLRGVFLSNRAVLASMLARQVGWIVNVASSRASLRGHPYAAAYCASKFGVVAFTEALAEEVTPHGIAVTALLPDIVETPMLGELGRAMLGVALPPARVADLVIRLLTLEGNARMIHPLVAPMMNPTRPFSVPRRGFAVPIVGRAR